MIIALAILAFFACVDVYMYTDLTEHMAEQMRLDNLWEDEQIGADEPSRGLETREGLTANVGADIYPWPRVILHARAGQGDEAA